MLESTEMGIIVLGLNGFHGKFIAKQIKRYDGTPVSVGQVYAVCKKHGVRLRDYRDGIGLQAETTIEECLDGDTKPRKKIKK